MSGAAKSLGVLILGWAIGVGALGCCKGKTDGTDDPPPAAQTPAEGPACSEEGSFCTLSDGTNGVCEQGRCKSPCGPGQFLFGGTHCAKACKGPTDCPGGACEEGICVPLCPPACPYKW